MRFISLLPAVSLFFATALFGASELRTFKDSQGREMQAKLTRVSGEDVYIEHVDGRTMKTDLSIYSKEDQKFIQEWEHKQMVKSGVIETRFTTENTSKKKSTAGGIEREDYESAYGIVLNNTSFEDLKDIRVEYLVLKFEDAIAAQKRSEGEIRRLKGSVKLPLLKARSEEKLKTESFKMLETKLEPNYYWVGGGKKTSKDTLDGIWIKIYVGDVLADEISRPENMIRTEVW